MPSIESCLLKDEKITFRARVHWIIFFMPIVLLVVGVGLLQGQYYLHSIALLFFIMALGLGIMSLITYAFSDFAVTDQRVLIKRGMLTQTVNGIMLNRIESVQVRQDISARLFNYGDIDIIGTGSSDDHIASLDSPYEFRKAILESMPR